RFKNVRTLLRPHSMSDDSASIFPVYGHALRSVEAETLMVFDYVIGLQPTSPFRVGNDIDECLKIAISKDYDVCVSVKESEENPYFTQLQRRKESAHLFEPLFPGRPIRRQD